MDFINNSKIAAGLAMIMLNIGSRYVQADLGKTHDLILSNELVKKLIVFSMFFIATRDILIAFILTIFYIIIVDGILHEKRKFCLIPKKLINESVSQFEYDKALEIINRYENSKTSDIDHYENYRLNFPYTPL